MDPHFLTSALGGDEWSVSRPYSFTSRDRASSTLWIGGWLGLRIATDTVKKRKISWDCHELNPDRPTCSI
jgi:hypothetical protein